MCIFMREIMVGEEKRSKDRRMEKCFFPPRREGGDDDDVYNYRMMNETKDFLCLRPTFSLHLFSLKTPLNTSNPNPSLSLSLHPNFFLTIIIIIFHSPDKKIKVLFIEFMLLMI